MLTNVPIDIAFDLRSDASGRDPDTFSPTLRRYHKLLWSKPLPGGVVFGLDNLTPGAYLHHLSAQGEFFLASDSVIPTFSEGGRLWHSDDALPLDEQLVFERLTYTIGGMMIFPGNRIGRQMTINGARGCHPRIRDRFDLTVECIRRHYGGEPNPLDKSLQRYADFFRLFEDFRGYVDFFMLQDLVSADYSTVRFFLPFHDFTRSPIPKDAESYRAYRQFAELFLESRNGRIRDLGLTL